MRTRTWLSALALAILALPLTASAQKPVQFSAQAGLGAPIGRLSDNADLGFNLGVRGEVPMNPKWGFRGDAAYDRFTGKAGIGSYSYLSLGGNLVHHEVGRLYEFGGVGVYRTEVTSTTGLSRNESNLGMQGGLGLNMTADMLKTFVEFGATGVFATGTNQWWFPVRFGIRF